MSTSRGDFSRKPKPPQGRHRVVVTSKPTKKETFAQIERSISNLKASKVSEPVDIKAAVKHCRKSWDAEIEKRVDEIRSGKVKGIPAGKVFAKIKAKYH